MGTHVCPRTSPDSAVGESTASLRPHCVLEPPRRSALTPSTGPRHLRPRHLRPEHGG